MTASKRVVAVQLTVAVGEVAANLHHIRDIVGQAVREHSPQLLFRGAMPWQDAAWNQATGAADDLPDRVPAGMLDLPATDVTRGRPEPGARRSVPVGAGPPRSA